jgi:hypothetical protein
LSKSNNLAPSTKATRSSSEYEQLIRILFIVFSVIEKENSGHASKSFKSLIPRSS